MKQSFISWQPNAKTQVILGKIDTILEDFRGQGYVLTLRQLYYQLVARDIIPNNVKEYNNLGRVVSKGRLVGLIDWDMIEDRIRVPVRNTHWRTGSEILHAAANGFYMNRWESQEKHVEVWCEKDAVSNIIEPVCRKWDVLFMANRGYASQSAMYCAYRRYGVVSGVLIYLGDHDPSGMDMTRDVEDRLHTFGIWDLEVNRIALNMPQVQQYQPPENPAKLTDTRAREYIARYGDASWELDALTPSVLSQIVEDAILEHLDQKLFDEVVEREEAIKERVKKIADGFA